MSDFEFISVILSIVVALGITRILSGLASLIELRGRVRMHWLSVAWATFVLLWQVVYWFGIVNGWRGREVWTFGNFGTLFLMGVALYFAAALVLPRRIDPDTNLVEHYAMVRRPLFAVYAASPVLDLMDSAVGGIDNLMALDPSIWIGHTISAGIGVLGFFTTSERLHSVIIAASLAAMLGLIGARIYVI